MNGGGAAAARGSGNAWRTALLASSSILVGAVLVLLRQRGPGALDTLWAEDGEIFLQQAIEDPSPWGWLRAYAGYLHLAPRVVASLAAILPLEWAPVVFSGSAALAAAGVAAVSFRAAEAHVPPWRARAVLALALLALPVAGLEAANAAANIHWWLLAGLGWVALWRPRGRAGLAVAASYLFVAAASDPFAVVAAPVLAWRLLPGGGDRDDRLLASALAAGLLLQAGVVLANAGSRPLDPFSATPALLAQWYGFQVLEGAALGVVLRDSIHETFGVAAGAVLALALLGVALAPALRAALRRPSLVPVSLAGLHLGLFFLPVVLSGVSTSRYAVAPIVQLYALAAWGLCRDETGWRRFATPLAVGVFVVVAALDFAPWNARADGPRWSEELATARERCVLASPASIEVLLPPRPELSEQAGGDGHRWSLRIACAALSPAPEPAP